MIYLDYAANTPVDKRVLNDFNNDSIKYFANPNSTHKLGLEAKEKIDEVSKYILDTFNIKDSEVIYTSGASESNNLVIKGFAEKNKNGHIITTMLEHSSIIAPCNYLLNKDYNVDILDVNSDGLIDIKKLESLIGNEETLVSITSVETETGIIENIEEIAEVLKKYPNVIFHTDATGSIGKTKINFENVDMISFAPHKFYGISGIGVLIKREDIKLIPLIHGGASTTIYRSGTPTLPLITSVKSALDLSISEYEKNKSHIKKLNEYIKSELKKYSNVVINSNDNSIYNTINISLKNKSNLDIVKVLEENEIYVSTKSACSSKENISKVIYALTNDENLSKNTIRISLSHLTTKEEIDKFLEIFIKEIK